GAEAALPRVVDEDAARALVQRLRPVRGAGVDEDNFVDELPQAAQRLRHVMGFILHDHAGRDQHARPPPAAPSTAASPRLMSTSAPSRSSAGAAVPPAPSTPMGPWL